MTDKNSLTVLLRVATQTSANLNSNHLPLSSHFTYSTMISDASLYSLAVFLGSASMLLIVLYHFLEINAKDATPLSQERKADAIPVKPAK